MSSIPKSGILINSNFIDRSKETKLYSIWRKDFHLISNNARFTIAHIGTHAITVFLTEAEVFELWCLGIKAESATW